MRRSPLCGLLVLSCALAMATACNGSTDAGSIQILIGEQTDTFTQSPPVTQIIVTADVGTDAGYSVTTLATAAYPASTIDLGEQDEETVATLQVAGEDANGLQLVYGQSLAVEYGALAGTTLPIFVQRVGQNANLPNPLADARQSPTLSILSGRFLIESGGPDSTLSSTTNVYDFAQFDEISGPPTLPVAGASMPIVGTIGLVISSSGAAYYDFSGATSTVTGVAPPTDGGAYSWADVAGGQSIYDSYDGLWFVVGATQTTGTPTQAVLEINTNDLSNSSYLTGNLHWFSLSSPRLGASVAWLPTTDQLVVGGGSGTAAGIEVLQLTASGASNGVPLSFPPDASVGSGMSWQGAATTLLMAGGVLPSGADAGVRILDTTCPTCPKDTWVSAFMCGSTPCPLTLCSAFSYSQAQGFLVGSETSTGTTPGLTHTFFLTNGAATEIPTRVPHTNASAIESPVGSVLIVGGNAEFESFIPCPGGVCASGGPTDGGSTD